MLFRAEGRRGRGWRRRWRNCTSRRTRRSRSRQQHPDPVRPGRGPRARRSRRCSPAPGLHHHLIREGTRTRVGLVLETGEPREVHHFSLLIGYGAGAVNPYLAFETLDDMIRQNLLTDVDPTRRPPRTTSRPPYKGVVKIASKMGISTIALLLRRADLRGHRPVKPWWTSTSPGPPRASRARAWT